jgi:GT2 family glycosyltransferase
MKYAAFVMTFRRKEKLKDTIDTLFRQTVPPHKVLIVDNDPEMSAEKLTEHYPENTVGYYAMGYNSGPAGAAKKGLEILVDEGYDWIAWIDDDDPPFFDDTMEVLLQLAMDHPEVGCVGAVGQYFDLNKALFKRVPDEELNKPGILYVDNIAGNMSKIIRAEAVRKFRLLPDESLFFGFEELDFDLRLRQSGYRLACDRGFYWKHRELHGRQNLRVKQGGKKNDRGLSREYYSVRNILIILKKQKAFVGMSLFVFRIIVKILLGFRFGFSYGVRSGRIIFSAMADFVSGKRGGRTFLFEKKQFYSVK